ncbi:MAG: CapA family protein [Aristaeellaceae bacterium]
MSRKRKRRGISLGTVVMLTLTIVVTVGMLSLLPKLMGDTRIEMDASAMLDVFSMSDGLPELSLSDIPISIVATQPTATANPATQEQVQAAATPTPLASTPVPTVTPYAGGSFTLTLGGSICMDDAVRKSCYYSESQKYDFTELLSQLKGDMQSDLVMLSLENLVIPDSKVSSLNAPEAVMTMLSSAGVSMVALGFTQAYDQGANALASTVKAARDAGLTTLGAYTSQEDADNLRLVTLNNVKVAFLHYTQSLSTKSAKAVKSADAAYAVPLAEAEKIQGDIVKARTAGAQVVIVSVHWNGSKSTPSDAQVKLAQQIADAGADVIVGTGTGILQPVTWLTGQSGRKTLCAYSLGTLVSESRTNGGVAAALMNLRMAVDGTGRIIFGQTAYTPTYIWRYKQDGQYCYRVVASDLPAPDGMSADQQESMERALANAKKFMGSDSPLILRTR